MALPNDSKNQSVCPTCGTQVNKNATRCLVCGTDLNQTQQPRSHQERKQYQTDPFAGKRSSSRISGSQMPVISFSAPVLVILLVLLVSIGGGLTYLGLSLSGGLTEPEITNTPTITLPPPVTEASK